MSDERISSDANARPAEQPIATFSLEHTVDLDSGTAASEFVVYRIPARGAAGPAQTARRERETGPRGRARVVVSGLVIVAVIALVSGLVIHHDSGRGSRVHQKLAVHVVASTTPVTSAPATTAPPTPAQLAQRDLTGSHAFALRAVKCVGISTCPEQSRQSIAVQCRAGECTIVNPPNGVWQGRTILLRQASDPRRFTTTIHTVLGRGFFCDQHAVDTTVLLDLHLTTPVAALGSAGPFPILGTFTLFVARHETVCGPVAPAIQWRAVASS